MVLIKSISGIRGTIGGEPGENLTPQDVVTFTAAFGSWIKSRSNQDKIAMVVGRDARVSGVMVENLVVSTLTGLGVDVILLGLATTPTVEMAVIEKQAQGGIIITASHNPAEWNALKLLNHLGEFISAENGEEVLKVASDGSFKYASYDKTGSIIPDTEFIQTHIQKIIDLELVDRERIQRSHYKVVVDGINSVGGVAVPALLKNLGVDDIVEINCRPDGLFSHNPEPIPENLTALSRAVTENSAHLGFAVDPDVDRLVIVCEDGSMFGEEYTLVSVADYILQYTKGNTVSNLSSTRALKDITERHGNEYFTAAVGEVNVVHRMKEVDAVIGGEGNGGIIYPALHYGRDALVGIALFLSQLARTGKTCSELRKLYPDYTILKTKVELKSQSDFSELLQQVKKRFSEHKLNEEDGIRIEDENGWLHIRKSNTEPIVRIIAESNSTDLADKMIKKVMDLIKPFTS
ncbi:MAG: phosphoglucosamine mutase [Bacteroidales bacterium]|nr:phosphoglucosamine mutase [Bacteroidales bacterium]